MSEPTITEQLEAARKRTFDAELAAAKAEVQLEFADAQLRAAQLLARNSYVERRLSELESALGRRQRARHDAGRGLQRFRESGSA